jgi:hypothetical protein
MVSGRTERLGLAVSEVEVLADHLQVLEMQRAEASDRVAAQLGLPAEAGLSEVAVAAGPPWSQILLDHRTALIGLSQELRALGEATGKLAAGGVDVVQLCLRELGVGTQAAAGVGYDASGRSDASSPGLRMVVDRVM